MSYWLTDPELFLYTKATGSDDVQLWRCKKPVSSTSSSSSSSLVVPMKPDDFDYIKNVTDYLELLADMIEWDETDYKKLVQYIYERRLLVNIQGLVIAEIYKLEDAKEVPIYIRSLDVLALKPYIPNLRERPIPPRTVQVLEDVNGKAAMVEEEKDFNITKLTARVADLESKNKSLEGKVAKLTADLATQMDAMANLQRQLNRVLENPNNIKEVWMNDLTNSEWVGIGGLRGWETFDNLIIIGKLGSFTEDDNSTNVKARYWYKMNATYHGNFKAILLEDLTPNNEKARFSRQNWHSFTSKGTIGLYRILN